MTLTVLSKFTRVPTMTRVECDVAFFEALIWGRDFACFHESVRDNRDKNKYRQWRFSKHVTEAMWSVMQGRRDGERVLPC